VQRSEGCNAPTPDSKAVFALFSHKSPNALAFPKTLSCVLQRQPRVEGMIGSRLEWLKG
jgi:hypothetical protein